MESWDEIAARIELCLVVDKDWRPNEADLDAYEAKAGFKLPFDYRRFALAYGRGLMGSSNFEFRFDTPWSKAERRSRAARKSTGRRGPDLGLDEFEGNDPAGRRRRLVIFSSVLDYGDVFAWDPAEVTDPVRHEMAIYLIGGRGHVGLFCRAGSNFLQVLVDEVLRGPHDRYMMGEGRDDLGPLCERYYFNHVPDRGGS